MFSSLGSNPRICMVAPACCIRVIKQAIVLKDRGFRVDLITNDPNNRYPFFNSVRHYESKEDLEYHLQDVADYTDVFHMHNEPSWPVYVMRSFFNRARLYNKKIIMDYHDSNYFRYDNKLLKEAKKEIARWHEEDIACTAADAFVAPSEPAMKYIANKNKGKQVIVLPSATPESMYLYKQHNFIGGLVSQGGHVIPEKVTNDHWRNYTPLYTKLKELGVSVYAYSPGFSDKDSRTYRHFEEITAGLFAYNHSRLLYEMQQHSWNLVGNWIPDGEEETLTLNHVVWKYALPNKFFDAVASGVPSVVFSSCKEAARIVEALDIGIVVDSPQELVARWDECEDKRTNLYFQRDQLSMESFIDRLINLYMDVLNGRISKDTYREFISINSK